MENKLISVIVPVYMVEKYLDKCILSIINQTYTNLEIILVNDGSKDNCLSICQKYANSDTRIKIIDKKNGGLSDARNAGLNIAQGDYIGFVDSDDYIEKNMYERLITLLEKNNADISVCAHRAVYENQKNDIEDKSKSEKIEIFNKQEAMNKLLEDKQITNHVWTKLYKKKLFEDVRFPIGKKYEDIGTTFYLFDKANTIVYTNEILYNYLKRKNSIIYNETIETMKDRVEMEKVRADFLREKGYNKEIIDKGILSGYIYILWASARLRYKDWYNSDEANKIYKEIKSFKFFYSMKILSIWKKKVKLCILRFSKKFTYIIHGIFKNTKFLKCI